MVSKEEFQKDFDEVERLVLAAIPDEKYDVRAVICALMHVAIVSFRSFAPNLTRKHWAELCDVSWVSYDKSENLGSPRSDPRTVN